MLTITIPEQESFDDKNNMFMKFEEHTLCLEHSLVSVSKWESKWHKPFISNVKKSDAEIIDYIKCMTITQNVDPLCYKFLTIDNLKEVNAYIENTMTATTFMNNRRPGSGSKKNEVITSELIYYWMISCQIPFECQKWHLNRLLTLIRVCNIKNNTNDKKMSKGEILSRNKDAAQCHGQW